MRCQLFWELLPELLALSPDSSARHEDHPFGNLAGRQKRGRDSFQDASGAFVLTQPLRAKTRMSLNKAAANEEAMRYIPSFA